MGEMSQAATQRVDFFFLEKLTVNKYKEINQLGMLQLDKIIKMKPTHTSTHLGYLNHCWNKHSSDRFSNQLTGELGSGSSIGRRDVHVLWDRTHARVNAWVAN